jgi:hypothetical protein
MYLDLEMRKSKLPMFKGSSEQVKAYLATKDVEEVATLIVRIGETNHVVDATEYLSW